MPSGSVLLSEVLASYVHERVDSLNGWLDTRIVEGEKHLIRTETGGQNHQQLTLWQDSASLPLTIISIHSTHIKYYREYLTVYMILCQYATYILVQTYVVELFPNEHPWDYITYSVKCPDCTVCPWKDLPTSSPLYTSLFNWGQWVVWWCVSLFNYILWCM